MECPFLSDVSSKEARAGLKRVKLHLYVEKSKVLQSSSSSSSFLVLDKILIPEDEHEDEDEKYEIRVKALASFL